MATRVEDRTRGDAVRGVSARSYGVDETKAAFKTTEFWAMVALVIAVLIAGNSIEGEEGGTDFFAADKVWLYITILTVGYMISRGIAKSGVRDPYWDERGDRNADH